jgi:hypothetical protein
MLCWEGLKNQVRNCTIGGRGSSLVSGAPVEGAETIQDKVVRLHSGWRFLYAVLMLVTLARGVHGQTQPLPEVPTQPEEPSDESAAPLGGAVPVAQRPRAWDYEAGIGGTWDSNIGFLQEEGDDGVAVVPRASVTRLFWNPRGEVRLRASGRWVGYPDQTDRSRGYGNFGIEGTRRASARTSWHFGASYDLGYTDSSQVLKDQGILLAISRADTIAADIGVTHKLGRVTSLRVGGRLFRTEFDAPELFDGSSIRGTVTLDQGLGDRSTGAIVYSLEDVLADQVGGGGYLTHYGSLQLTRALNPRTALLLEGGLGFTPDAERARLDRKVSFFGGASLSRQLGPSSVSAYVRREVTPAFGAGVSRPQVRMGLAVDVTLGRSWDLRMGGTHVLEEGADAAGGYPASSDAHVALACRFARALALSAESSYRRRGATVEVSAVEGFSAGLYLTVRRPGPRLPRPPRQR